MDVLKILNMQVQRPHPSYHNCNNYIDKPTCKYKSG